MLKGNSTIRFTVLVCNTVKLLNGVTIQPFIQYLFTFDNRGISESSLNVKKTVINNQFFTS